MKRCFTVLVSILLAALCAFSASAIVIDGYNNGGEWAESSYYLMFSSAEQSGCSAQYADLQVQISDSYTVCLLIQVIDPSFSESKSGARVSIGGRGYTLAANGAANYSNVKYSSHCNNPVEDNGYVIEAQIALAEPIENNISLSVAVIDGNGSVSKKTTAEAAVSAVNDDNDWEETKTITKTTVPKTARSTSAKTTKPKTTKPGKSTTKKNSKSNKSDKPPKRKTFGKSSNNDYNFVEEETVTSDNSNLSEQDFELDLSEDNTENAGRYKIILGILIFLVFTAGAVIIIIPRVHKKSNKEKDGSGG